MKKVNIYLAISIGLLAASSYLFWDSIHQQEQAQSLNQLNRQHAGRGDDSTTIPQCEESMIMPMLYTRKRALGESVASRRFTWAHQHRQLQVTHPHRWLGRCQSLKKRWLVLKS